MGLIQGFSSGTLIIFYAITKFKLVTASEWILFTVENKDLLENCKNENRLSVQEMSIE